MEADPDIILLIAVACILVMLAVILNRLYKLKEEMKWAARAASSEMVERLDKSFQDLKETIQCHTEVNTALMHIDPQSELRSKLPEHAERVVAAAILIRLNGIAAQIVSVQAGIESAEADLADSMSKSSEDLRERNSKRLTELFEELETVRGVARQFGIQVPG